MSTDDQRHWTNIVVLTSLHIMDSALSEQENPSQLLSVYVSDWRDCREGHPAFDLGPFMADLAFLYKLKVTLAADVARGFVQGYFDTIPNGSPPGNTFIFHILVHIGVCMIIRDRNVVQQKNAHTSKYKDPGTDKKAETHKNTETHKNMETHKSTRSKMKRGKYIIKYS